ncbi:MAG: Holliday junction branch migration protein RuvA [Lachnospiraceae bacterium]|nr:Holliday junction branch migration protein RuvA [Lachnospiraceae bacterium]
MIAFIEGELAEKCPDGIVVDCGGVGYFIGVPVSLIGALPQVGSRVKIHTYLHVREDAMQLYGFASKKDLELFKLLINVSGIGPKGALSILGSMTPEQLRMAIVANDAKVIAKSPGIGAKTAQKIILELSDKVNIEDMIDVADAPAFAAGDKAGAALSGVAADVMLALVSLGYSNSQALAAVSAVSEADATDESTMLKAALKNIR